MLFIFDNKRKNMKLNTQWDCSTAAINKKILHETCWLVNRIWWVLNWIYSTNPRRISYHYESTYTNLWIAPSDRCKSLKLSKNMLPNRRLPNGKHYHLYENAAHVRCSSDPLIIVIHTLLFTRFVWGLSCLCDKCDPYDF